MRWEGGKWEAGWGWAPVSNCPQAVGCERGSVVGKSVLGSSCSCACSESSSLCSPCNAPPGMEGEGAMWEQAAAAHGTLQCFNVWWKY